MVEFFGAFNLDGNAPDDVALMKNAFPLSIGNPFISWHNNLVSFSQRSFKIAPEPDYKDLPYYDAESEIAVMGDIRLDGRAELCDALSIPHKLRPQVGDYRLIINAYKKWGESFSAHLLGDFAIVLWDVKQQKLLCTSDHFGLRGLFYYYNGRKIVLASSPHIVAEASGTAPAINYNKIATLIFIEAKHLFWEESWFENVKLLQAATTIVVDNAGLRKHKYWEPSEVEEQRFKNDEEFGEAFYDVMERAVDDRLRSNKPVSALLSGGLDSSSIVAVAAKVLEKQNKQLQVFSAVLPPGNNGDMTDERDFIDQFKSFPNININYITAPHKGFFSDLEALQGIIHSPNLISRHYLYSAFVEGAHTLGSNVILDGLGGEFGATCYASGAYAELFIKMRWQTLWHELKKRQIIYHRPLLTDIKQQVISPLLPGSAIDTLRGRNIGLDKTREHCIQPDLVQMLKERLEPWREQIKSASRKLSPFHRKNQVAMMKLKQTKAQGTANLGSVEARYPLMDKRLLEFCLSVPIDFKIRNGYERCIVRTGLNKILPSEIQWRTSKGAFSPDYNRRYNDQSAQTKAYLADISFDDPIRKIVDVEKLKTLAAIPLRDSEFNTFAEKAARDFVPQGIYLIEFLRRFTEFQKH